MIERSFPGLGGAKSTLERLPTIDRLDGMLGERRISVGDLIGVKVLHGFTNDAEFRKALDLMSRFPAIRIGGHDVAVAAARNYRSLRLRAIAVRKAIDTLIATRCIIDGLTLLYSTRDFDPFVQHLGLASAIA